ncbi:MAG: methylmalonyl Co-A mutase-associated GTPase MeaB [Cytophagales bacterium]|nr:methylmalonyl Co-A mutase-associated GTPase MeaB [Cytophagales bacterium]
MASKKRKNPTVTELCKGILAGERAMLARAITLAESTHAADRKKIAGVLRKLMPHTGKSIRLGITGIPGVGKSTFIEAFGDVLTQEGKKIGVLTVDPTSQKTKGSILGDKTRMERLSRNPNVFIRPSPTGLALGGVTPHTREAILLCEAAGFDVILIETVGVGQSETIVRGMVDFFLLLMLTGAGDELQGIKKGIMEMADGIVITKADGENKKAAVRARADALQALHFQSPAPSGWKPRALTASALDGAGLKEIWKMILEFETLTKDTGYFDAARQDQLRQWLDESLEVHFRTMLTTPDVMARKKRLVGEILRNGLLPTDAARLLWEEIIAPDEET